MLNLNIVYLIVLVVALVQWGLMRLNLYRGLQKEFNRYRKSTPMNYFFDNFAKSYLTLVASIVLHCLFLIYCGIQLAKGLGLLNLESVIFIVVVSAFFFKDRIYYSTADFVLSKRE